MPELRQHSAQDQAKRSRRRALVIGAAVLSFPLIALAAPVQIPYVFSAGDPILASEINEDFAALAVGVNDNNSRIAAIEADVLDFGGVPAGAVMFFDLDACPDGWAEMQELRGRVPLGLPANGMIAATVGTGLEDGALRTITEVPSHSHLVDPPALNTQAGGDHSHPVNPPATNTNSAGTHAHAVDPPNANTTAGGGHSHVIDPPLTGTNTTGSHTHTVNNGNGGLDSAFLQAANSVQDGAVADSSAPIFPAGNHSHTVDIGPFNSNAVANHSHAVNIGPFNSANAGNHAHSVDIGQFNSGGAGSHSHAVDISPFNSSSAGTASVDVTMPYIQLLACTKM